MMNGVDLKMQRNVFGRAGCGRFFAASLRGIALLIFAAVATMGQQAAAPAPAKKAAGGGRGAKPRADVARFRERVDAALGEAHAEKALWGVLVTDRDTGEILYELNGDRFFTPASNAKIVTTSLALGTLGPTYQFRTTLESSGKFGEDGRLLGDLIFVGRGDPDLSNRKFPYAGKVEHDGPAEKVLAQMADDAIAKGLKEIDGDIVADDSYYPYDPYPAGWSVGDLYFTFGALVSAIAFNDNSISVAVSPGIRVGDPAVVAVEPAAAMGTFGHELTTGLADGKPEFGVVRQAGPQFLLLRGTMPLGHAPIKLDLAMADPAETVAVTLKQVFEARGVRVTGTIRVKHAPPAEIYPDAPVVLGPAPLPAPADTIVFALHISPPLSEIVRVTNKVSQNLHAELLLRAVAHEKKGFGVTDAGIWAEQDFLKTVGVADGE